MELYMSVTRHLDRKILFYGDVYYGESAFLCYPWTLEQGWICIRSPSNDANVMLEAPNLPDYFFHQVPIGYHVREKQTTSYFLGTISQCPILDEFHCTFMCASPFQSRVTSTRDKGREPSDAYHRSRVLQWQRQQKQHPNAYIFLQFGRVRCSYYLKKNIKLHFWRSISIISTFMNRVGIAWHGMACESRLWTFPPACRQSKATSARQNNSPWISIIHSLAG